MLSHLSQSVGSPDRVSSPVRPRAPGDDIAATVGKLTLSDTIVVSSKLDYIGAAAATAVADDVIDVRHRRGQTDITNSISSAASSSTVTLVQLLGTIDDYLSRISDTHIERNATAF